MYNRAVGYTGGATTKVPSNDCSEPSIKGSLLGTWSRSEYIAYLSMLRFALFRPKPRVNSPFPVRSTALFPDTLPMRNDVCLRQ